MATETTKIVVETEITGTAKVSQSLADLKKELKAAQSAALNGDGVAAKRVAELRDKMDDLKDSVKTLQGSGVEKAQSSFRLLGDGLKNFDFDKIKIGFKGIGTAMAAIPVFLIAEGISYLVENWKELSEGTGVVAKVLQSVTWVFTKLKEEIYAVTDALGWTNSQLEKQGEAIKTNADKAKEALEGQNAEYDRQIRVAKAAGKSTIELEQAKQQAIIDTNLAVARQIEAFVRAGGEFDDEKRKLLTASLEAIKNAKVTEYELEQNQTKQLKEEYKKRSDEKKKANEQIAKDADDLFKQLSAQQDADDKKELERREKEKADRAKHLEDLKALQLKADQEQVALQVEQWNAEEKLAKDRLALKEKEEQDKLMITQQALNSSLALSDLVFTLRLNQTKKGSAEELKVRKQQFQVEKAFKVAQIVMDGIQGAMKAYAMNPLPSPIGIISASLQGVAAAAAAVKVAATKFDAGSSGSADTGGGGLSLSSNVGGSGNAPTMTNAPTVQPFTKLDESGRNQSMPTVKAYVVESEMTDSQKRVGRLAEQASF